MRVLVVGGGCAGLTAAYTLAKRGVGVHVIEKAPVIGGRMTMLERDGFSVNVAAQLIHPGYRMARRIIDEIGIGDEVLQASMAGQKLFYNGGWIDPNPRPDDAEGKAKAEAFLANMGAAFPRFCQWVESRCKGLMYEGSVDWMLDIDGEDGGNFEDYVRREFGDEVLECFVQPVISTIGLTDPSDVGIGFGLQLMWTVLVGEAAVLKNGIGSLAQRLVDAIGDNIEAGRAASRVVIDGARVRGVETAEGFIPADVVICAVQGNKVNALIPDLPQVMRDALAKVTYCPVIHAMIFVDRVMSGDGMMGGMLPRRTGSPFCGILFHSKNSAATLPKGKDCISAFFYGAGCRKYWGATDEEITDVAVRQLRSVLPDLPAEILFSEIRRIPEGNYTMHAGAATAMRDLRVNHYQEVEGLFLCGDYIYTGSYESALCSGREAAELAMESLKRQ